MSTVGDLESRAFLRQALHAGRGGFGRLLKGAALCLALAGGIMAGTAPDAEAGGGYILSTKSVAAPLGFNGICERYPWACSTRSSVARAMSDAELMAIASRVNGSVNARVRQVSDRRQYRQEEYWALPTAKGGDCEDFALQKKLELIQQGVSPDRLLIATALTRSREAHAVLIVRTESGDMVLDNRSSRIKPWHATDLSFLRIQSPEAPGRWRMVLAGGMFG